MNKDFMKIIKETPVEYVNMDAEFSGEAEQMILDYARENIFKDKDAMISWAVGDILQKQMDKYKKVLDTINSLKTARGQMRKTAKMIRGLDLPESDVHATEMLGAVSICDQWIKQIENETRLGKIKNEV